MILYSKKYFQNLQEGSLRSAEEIVPLVLELVHPHQVIDVGCGIGAWLAVFKEHGVEDIQGVDGKWVAKDLLHIPHRQFLEANLEEPLRLDREFDLVVSLEVAEHLPADRADTFVDTLTRLGPVVLFSAAIPFQEGKHHLNEQWLEYWEARFLAQGYVAVDSLRKKVWQNDKVDWWYRQNALFFVRESRLNDYPLLKEDYESTRPHPLSIVHPRLHLEMHEQVSELREWVTDLQKQETELRRRVEELHEWALELQELKPGSVSLKKVLRALPGLVKHAFEENASALFRRISSGVL